MATTQYTPASTIHKRLPIYCLAAGLVGLSLGAGIVTLLVVEKTALTALRAKLRWHRK